MAKNKDFAVMLAKTYDPARIKSWDHMHIEPKHDGVRVLIFVDGLGNVTYKSRNGRELDMFGHIDESAKVVMRLFRRSWPEFKAGVVLDGEMCSLTKAFGDISGAIHRKNATVRSAVFRAFAVLPWRAFADGVDGVSQGVRQKQLWTAVSAKKPESIWFEPPSKVNSDASVQAMYVHFQEDGHEGAMVKDLSKPWEAKRSWAWMKMKAELSKDLTIIAFKPGKGKYQGTLGALIVDHGGVPVPVSGMDDALRRELWRNRREHTGKMVEVTYQEVTKRGSLRHPRFKRLRPDKD